MKRYEIPGLSEKEVHALGKEKLINNACICETAGFEPLEVRMKRLEMNGMLRNAQRSELTANDYREMYLNPDYNLSLDDEPEDIIEKMKAIQQHIREVQQKAYERAMKEKVGSLEQTANSPSGSAAAKKEDSEKDE